MTTRPPELKLIEDSRETAGLSRAAAAKAAGISDTWWRKVETGEQPLTGRKGLRTLARMAHAVSIPPGELEKAGRPDIEAELAKLRLDEARSLEQAQADAEQMVKSVGGLTTMQRAALEEAVTKVVREIRENG